MYEKLSGLTIDNYPNNMKSFINNYMTKHRHTDEQGILIINNKIADTLKKVHIVFGNQAFRKWIPETSLFDRKLNLSIMDCQMLACEKYNIDKLTTNKNKVDSAFKKLYEDQLFISSISEGTSGKKNILLRLEKTLEVFKKILG